MVLVIAALSLLSCTQSQRIYNEGINIIPTPVEMELAEGEGFVLDKSTVIVADGDLQQEVARFFAEKVLKSTGYKLKTVSEVPAGNYILLDLNPQMEIKNEGYTLEVNSQYVVVSAKDRSGLFYGMATLMQLFPAEIESLEKVRGIEWSAPAVKIADYPRFSYRGLHLDPCRHFMSVEDVKKHLDLMSMFKFNIMHFHLTEDQGWRIEIKKYPLLTELGSKRVEGEGFVHEGFYTQEELKELVEYARMRNITIIPEIEVPGHALAAITGYPWLSCNEQETTPRIIWGVEDVVMCAGKETTFEFVEDVIKEVVEIFPSEYIHIGGDECPKGEWEKCPLCQAKIKELGIDKTIKGHTPEMRLQSYFIGRVEKIVEKYGRKIIGWDEILEGGLAPSATVMSWRGLWGGIAAAMQGHDAIMTPSTDGYYFDHYQGDYRIEPMAIGGFTTLEKVYSYNPVPDTIKALVLEHHILGVQGNTWSEYMYDESVREYRIYPKAFALAEVAWSPMERKDFKDFDRRVNNAYVRLDQYDVNYHIPQPEQPGGSYNFIAFVDSTVMEFTTTRPVKMVYTMDGSEPTPSSREYTEPFVLTENTTVKIRSVLPSGKCSPVRTITVEKQQYAPATEIENVQQGLKMEVTQGTYLNRAELEAQPLEWTSKIISSTRELVNVVPSDNYMRENFPQFASVATGYIMIPEDGIYYFGTNFNDLSIDGKLVVNNDGKVKRFSGNGVSVALAKGLHPVKVTFLGHILGGWPSNWDRGDIMMREKSEEKFYAVTPEMLWY